MSITHVCTFLRRPLHDVKLPNATFCEGPRTHGDEVLLLDRDAVLKIQIPEMFTESRFVPTAYVYIVK